MASQAVEIPADSVLVSRDARADRSLRRRVFIASLVATCAVVLVAFVAIHFAFQAEIKAGVLHSLRQTQHSLEQAHAGRNLRDNMAVAWICGNPALIAAIRRVEQTHSASGSHSRAIKTVQKFARSARDAVQGEAAAVTAANGRVLAIVPGKGPVSLLFAAASGAPGSGLRNLGGTLYRVTTTPVRLRRHVIGALSVAARFDFSGLEEFGPLVLLHRGRAVYSTFPLPAAQQIQGLEPGCLSDGCELSVNGEDFLAIPVSRAAAGSALGVEDQLLSFRPVDAAMGQVTRGFRTRLPLLGVAVVLLTVCLSFLVSQAVSRPLHELVARLEQSRAAGRWEADFPEDSPMREVNQLAAAINHAALEVAQSNERLDQASIDFVETLAQALDARDPCTAGHSQRVSDYATAIATAMRLLPCEIETIRVGARLHDIGKIGISDVLLQKAGRLTPEEYETVKLHPQIGRRILERVTAFEPYLPLVELHHEDFDGQGYPYGLKGHETPLAVRVIRVADVFDALTTDRSYRQAIPLDRAYELIASRAGAKFDPDVVRALRAALGTCISSEMSPLDSLARMTLK